MHYKTNFIEQPLPAAQLLNDVRNNFGIQFEDLETHGLGFRSNSGARYSSSSNLRLEELASRH